MVFRGFAQISYLFGFDCRTLELVQTCFSMGEIYAKVL